MTTATLVLAAIEPELRIGALDGLAFTSALAAAVKRRSNAISIALQFRKADREIKNLLDRVNGIIEGRITIATPDDPVTRPQIDGLINSLDMIARNIDYIHESSRRVGLTNNSLTAGSLKSLVAHREGILDVADWLDASLKTDENAAILARASRERELGQTIDLDQVR
jgi:hypothetical protein